MDSLYTILKSLLIFFYFCFFVFFFFFFIVFHIAALTPSHATQQCSTTQFNVCLCIEQNCPVYMGMSACIFFFSAIQLRVDRARERERENESEITCIAKPHAHYAYIDSKCMHAIYITAAKCASQPTESNSSHWNSGTLVQRYKRCLFASHRINYSIEAHSENNTFSMCRHVHI